MQSLECQGTFNFRGSNMLFSSFVCCFSRTLYSLSVPGKQEKAELNAVLRTEVMRRGTCLDSFQWLPSVTSYLVMPSYSGYGMLSGPLKIGIYLDLFLLNFFYCLKLPCMKIYKHAFLQIKHPCLTRGLGPLHPSPHQLQSPGPGLQRLWRWNISMLDLLASEVSVKSCDWWGQAEEPSSEADRAVGQSWQEPTALGSIHIRGNLELLTQWDVMKQRAEHTGDGKPEQRFCAPETLSMRAKRAGSLRHVIQPGQEPRWWLSWGVWEQRIGRHILVQGQLLGFHTYFLFLVICTTAHSSVGWLGTAERFSWPHVVAQWPSGSWMEPPEGWTRPTSRMEHPCRQQLVLVVNWEPSVSCRWESPQVAFHLA